MCPGETVEPDVPCPLGIEELLVCETNANSGVSSIRPVSEADEDVVDIARIDLRLLDDV